MEDYPKQFCYKWNCSSEGMMFNRKEREGVREKADTSHAD